MFGESSHESFKGINEEKVGLNSIMVESNTNKEQENKTDMSRRMWNKELNKLVMKFYLISEPSNRGNRSKKGIEEGCMVYGNTGVFEITEQRLTD